MSTTIVTRRIPDSVRLSVESFDEKGRPYFLSSFEGRAYRVYSNIDHQLAEQAERLGVQE